MASRAFSAAHGQELSQLHRVLRSVGEKPMYTSLVCSPLLILQQELLRIGQELFHQTLQRLTQRFI